MLALPSKYTVGLDAEFILRDSKTHNPVSAIGKVGGSKKSPLRVPHGALQEDGVLAEINIDPVRSLFEFERNLSSVLKSLSMRVREHGLYVDLHSIDADYPDDQLDHYLAWESGCDPDFNCWTSERNPGKEFTDNMRTCGGHFHVGLPNPNEFSPTTQIEAARRFDSGVAFPICAYEPENRRRKYYGSVGSYRPKPYGVELRSPSNHWVVNPIMRKYFFFNMFRVAMVEGGSIHPSFSSSCEEYPSRLFLSKYGYWTLDLFKEILFNRKVFNQFCEVFPDWVYKTSSPNKFEECLNTDIKLGVKSNKEDVYDPFFNPKWYNASKAADAQIYANQVAQAMNEIHKQSKVKPMKIKISPDLSSDLASLTEPSENLTLDNIETFSEWFTEDDEDDIDF